MKSKKNIKEAFRITPVCIQFFFILGLFSIYGCSQSNQEKSVQNKPGKTIVLPQITFLANLPDSNKPKEIQLTKKPKSYTINEFQSNKPGNSSTSFTNSSSIARNLQKAQGNGFLAKYTTDNGLALDQVYCIYTDKVGNLWIGTNGGGVSKYDGKSFTNYTTIHGLANNVVWSITEDKDGNIWFGTDGGGASKYNGKTFTNYTTAQGLANNIVRCIVKDQKGFLWFATDGSGVSRYDGKKFTNFSKEQGLASNIVFSVKETKDGNIWLGTLDGVSKFDGQSFINYSTSNGLAKNDVRSILQDKSGNIWFGTNGNGVSKYDGKTFTNYTKSEGLSDNVVLSITEDKEGNIWFGTLKGGVSLYNGEKIIDYSTLLGLEGNSIRSITEDKSGNIWICTGENGVCEYEGKSFVNFTKANGLASNIIWTITEDKTGDLWFGTSGGGINKYTGEKIINYTREQGLAANEVFCATKDKAGNLWFGTAGSGVSKYDGKSFTNYTSEQGLSNNTIFCITEDSSGNLWFGTSGGGVSKYDGKGFTNYTTKQGLASNVVYNIMQDKKGNLWFGTFGEGATRYDGKSFVSFSINQGLSNNVVWTIKEDKLGNLWLGTQNGLNLIKQENLEQINNYINQKGKLTTPLFEKFTSADGLPDNFITQILPVSDKKLYVGTNQGICELIAIKNKKNGFIKWTTGKIFNSNTGYPVKDVNAGPGALFKDSKDIIWIATSSEKTGLVRFDPQAINQKSATAPILVIQKIKVNNQTICWNNLSPKHETLKTDSNTIAANFTEEVNSFGRLLSEEERSLMQKEFNDIQFDSVSKWYPIPQNLVLSHQHNEISFVFNAIETGRNFMTKYQYMLVGYDKGWSPLNNANTATYGNIFEGSYTFKLKAQGPDGVWSEPISYSFKVLPPWWRSWWMYAFYIAFISASIYLFVIWNNRRILHQKKILEHKVIIATKQIREEKDKVEAQKKETELTLIELKAAQSQLVQSEKMASLGELTAGIAHEIQNPLNFVNNFSEVSNELILEMNEELLKGNIDDAKDIANDLKQNLEKINHHGKRAADIVKGMLQHSRSSSGVKEPSDINALCDEYLRLSYHGLRAKDKSFNATMKTDFDNSIGTINIIPQEIGRVVLNLLTNAFYAVDEKSKNLQHSGKIGIGNNEEISYEPTVWVSTKIVGDKVWVSVKDNGNGIPPKVMDKIFQPFFTTKPTGQGTGLGLSLSYDIIKSHGGELNVDTKEGEGSTFNIILPL